MICFDGSETVATNLNLKFGNIEGIAFVYHCGFLRNRSYLHNFSLLGRVQQNVRDFSLY